MMHSFTVLWTSALQTLPAALCRGLTLTHIVLPSSATRGSLPCILIATYIYHFLFWVCHILVVPRSLSSLASSCSALSLYVSISNKRPCAIYPTCHLHELPLYIVHHHSIHVDNGHVYQGLLHFIVHHPYTCDSCMLHSLLPSMGLSQAHSN